jgi:peptide/nickel transport system permease protein
VARTFLLLRRGVGLLILLLIIVATVSPRTLWSLSPTAFDAAGALQPPSLSHPLGTDEAGSDLLARALDAFRLQVAIAIGSVLAALIVAVPAGLLSGYRGGLTDEGFSAVSNAIFAFPAVLLAVLVVASFGASVQTLVLVLSIVFVPFFFQLVRGQAMALRDRSFVLAARLNGASTYRIVTRHLLANVGGPLLVMIPQLMALAILIEAGLSYLGLGIQPPAITWGTLLQASRNYYAFAVWYPLTPGVIITVAASSLMFIGDALARRLDPRQQAGRRDAIAA